MSSDEHYIVDGILLSTFTALLPCGQFSQLPAPIELVPALGVENTLSLVQQASTLGGCDCVPVHPELLQDGRCGWKVCRVQRE
jgi:hypothetical protein